MVPAVNQRVMFLARRILGPDVEAAATGVLRPIAFGNVGLGVVLLGLMVLAGVTRSLWAVAGVVVVLAVAGLVVASGRQQRVLVAVRGGWVEVHRWRFPFRTATYLTRFPHRDLYLRNKGRSLLLYVAPGGEVEVDGEIIALNQPLE